MTMRQTNLALILIAGVAAALSAAATSEEPAAASRFRRVSERLVDAVNRADWPAVGRDFAPIMVEAFPPEKSGPFFSDITRRMGRIEKLGPAELTPPMIAVFPMELERGRLDLKVVLDGADKIIGLWVLPPADRTPVPARNSTPLDLPVRGRWNVHWGGETRDLNYHFDSPGQRFAIDMFIVGDSGRTCRGKGAANEDYYCWGQPILAPADGEVVEAIDGVRDNVPGSMNPFSAVGNCVVIRHSEGETSVLAHLVRGSVTVRTGDRVKAGHEIGRCGNSGNSSEPHLHYHLQNSPVLQDGKGIRPLFRSVRVTRDGKTEVRTDYMPVKGDVIGGAVRLPFPLKIPPTGG